MKKYQILNWILIAFVAFQFSSCENEPLEGEFPSGEVTPPNVLEGGFVAFIGNNEFIATSASAILTTNNLLTITGTITETGETIILTVEDAALGQFDLTSGIGTQNSGVYIASDTPLRPYISSGVYGATGQMQISEFDTENMQITGAFNFTGVRTSLDENGDPILDEEGNPVTESISVNSGVFNKVNYIVQDGGTSSGNNLFAKVDGVDFEALAVTTTQMEIGGEPMVKIVAVNENDEIIRIDIPEDLGVGTFAMQEISDGTKLIALYNPHTSGENLTSSPGTITITEFNTISGILKATFAFTASDPLGIDPAVHQITEGSFEVDYMVTAGETNTSFVAEVDGVVFTPDSVSVEEYLFNGVSRFLIVAIDTNTNQKMGLFFPTDIELGMYEMSTTLIAGDEKFAQYTPDIGNSITFISSPGTLTITDYNVETGFIKGTFNFNGIDVLNQDTTIYTVTNGEFTVEL